MPLDKNLDFALKYNWWTNKKDKKNISLITKLSYVLSRASSDELFFVFKNFSFEDLNKAYQLIKNDSFSLKSKRKWSIENLLLEKQNDNI